jgi:hypothetical protein
MRRFLLSMLLVVSAFGVAKAQETTGPVADQATKEVKQLENEKVQCFLSTAKGGSSCSDWIVKNYANEDLDISRLGGEPRRRSKSQVVDEIKSGQRKFLEFSQTIHVMNVYGNGGDGTTVVVTLTADGTSENNGKHGEFDDFCVDIWYKQGGKWSLILMNTRPAY